MRSGACDTLSRRCVRRVRCWVAFSSAPALRSIASAAGSPVLFGDFIATMKESDSHGRLPVKRCHFIFLNSTWLYWHPGLSLVLDLVVSQPVPTHIRLPFSATAAPKPRFRRAKAQEDETLLLIGD